MRAMHFAFIFRHKALWFKITLILCTAIIVFNFQKANYLMNSEKSRRRQISEALLQPILVNFTTAQKLELKAEPASVTGKAILNKISKTKRQNKTASEERKCKAKKGLVFVKTHKTGSTTLTNIVLRYAEKHQLLVGLPPPRHWELAGYPNSFRHDLIDPRADKYDVLCHHQRFQLDSVQKVVPENSFYFTALRDPVHQFESGVGFFRDWPFTHWLEETPRSDLLEKFMENPDLYYNTSTPWYFRAKNYMSFDLGLDNQRTDETYINWAIEYIEGIFDLVMITERMEESLILLKDMLCMESFNDIVNLRLKVRQSAARYNLTNPIQQQIREWNRLDVSIHQHFNEKLSKQVEAYGVERMTKDIEQFRKLLEETEKTCVDFYDSYDMKPWVSRIELRKNSGDFCNKLSWGEVKFGDYIRSIQTEYSQVRTEDQLSYNQLLVGLHQAQKSILGENGMVSNNKDRKFMHF